MHQWHWQGTACEKKVKLFFSVVEIGPPLSRVLANIDRASNFHTRGMGGAIVAVLANAGILKKWHGLYYYFLEEHWLRLTCI